MAKIKKIAIIAPPFTTVPPIGQGGIETILTYKINALVKMGHEVHLFGAGESSLKNCIYHQVFKKSINELSFDPALTEASRKIRLETLYIVDVLKTIISDDNKFDLIFNHTRATEMITSLVLDKIKIPIFNVFHLAILPEQVELMKKMPEFLAISISKDQISDWPDLKNFIGTVHNGIDPEKYPLSEKTNNFLIWVGTIGPHKNPIDAISAAKSINKKIILMGKIRDQDYFEKQIKPEINDNVTYVGELNYNQKLPYFQKAKAALFPTKIREACPVTPIELTMCGTPVVAYPSGGTKELIENGKNGFLVSNLDEMIIKVKSALALNRKQCHIYTKENFSSAIMAKKYIDIYEKYCESKN